MTRLAQVSKPLPKCSARRYLSNQLNDISQSFKHLHSSLKNDLGKTLKLNKKKAKDDVKAYKEQVKKATAFDKVTQEAATRVAHSINQQRESEKFITKSVLTASLKLEIFDLPEEDFNSFCSFEQLIDDAYNVKMERLETFVNCGTRNSTNLGYNSNKRFITPTKDKKGNRNSQSAVRLEENKAGDTGGFANSLNTSNDDSFDYDKKNEKSERKFLEWTEKHGVFQGMDDNLERTLRKVKESEDMRRYEVTSKQETYKKEELEPENSDFEDISN